MAETWELERYVEAHPEDYAQRWRLAKKLYMESEYRIALEHLLVLKKEWIKKLNVLRYLAATYYRMGRYEDAIAVLDEAIETWPDEVALREQLARVLESSGRKDDARVAWEEVLRLNPNHRLADAAVRRLASGHGAAVTYNEPEAFMESDSGADMAPKVACSQCGAINAADFERCWQCHAPLPRSATPMPSMRGPTPMARPVDRKALVKQGAMVGVLVLAAVLVTAYHMAGTPGPELAEAPPATVQEALITHMARTWAIVGGITLFAWPLIIAASLWPVGGIQRSWHKVVLVGMALASISYLLWWVPRWGYVIAPIVTAGAGLYLMYQSFRVTLGQAVAAWGLQLVLVLVLHVGIFIGLEGVQPVREAATIFPFAISHDTTRGAGVHPVARVPTPLQLGVRWESTGSAWLDGIGRDAVFEVASEGGANRLHVELRDAAGRVLKRHDIDSDTFRFTYPVVPGQEYVISVDGEERIGMVLTVYSIMKPRFEI